MVEKVGKAGRPDEARMKGPDPSCSFGEWRIQSECPSFEKVVKLEFGVSGAFRPRVEDGGRVEDWVMIE